MVQIGPVWPPLEYRGKGYARFLLQEILLKARGDGITKAILFTHNLVAARVYENVGFKVMGTYHLGILKRPYEI